MTRPSPQHLVYADSRLGAVLGPTNTGKTHLAIERMLGHRTGMIGLPLRLLAREVYERVCRKIGAPSVALLTGEEKIVPARARYWVCTVEAMPVSQPVDFLAVDEVQLAADAERGHVFTDRILRARGIEETLFLGSETARPLISKLLPAAHIETRPRFSELTFMGPRKLTRLPRRSAVVAFSAEQVYAIAELIRRHRGGAAVVMGALSPRTRNAQVELYQNGDVDFLVATDAIGMGLNMDIDHVAFAQTEKFDGRQHRPLRVSELAQIAGRAGRYANDGTFGTTGDAAPLDNETAERIEEHYFEPDRQFQWRNTDLNFSSIDRLIASLEAPPRREGLVRAPVTSDLETLSLMSRDREIRGKAEKKEALKLLWEVAQVPDFRKIMASDHAALLSRLYFFLMEDGIISEDWLAKQVALTDKTDGDIDTLSTRIAHMRTWAFVANRNGWLKDPDHWQKRTRAIEDKLSDALHERLTQRFIDWRTSVLMKRLRQNEELMASITADGEVLVEGEYVGRLQGFVFVADPRAEGVHDKVLRTASLKALASEIESRAARLAAAEDGAISLSEHGRLLWEGQAVAKLHKGESALRPKVELIASDQLTGPAREQVQARLEKWLSGHIAHILEPLVKLNAAEDIAGLARGIAFQLYENLGHLRRETVANELKELDQPARSQLRKYGVRFGAYSVFMPALLKPAPARLLLTLWSLQRETEAADPFADLPNPPAPGLTSAPAEQSAPQGFYEALGFRVCGTRAVRLDMLERLADLIRPVIAERRYKGGFRVTPDMMSLVGCSGEEFAGLLRGLGYRMQLEKVPQSVIEAEKQPPAPAAKTESKEEAKAAEAAPAPVPPASLEEAGPAASETALPGEVAAETAASEEPAADAVTETAALPQTTEEDTPTAAPETPAPAAQNENLEGGEAAPAAPAAETASADAGPDAAKTDEAKTGDELVEVEIWRPQRKNPRGRQPGHRGQSRDKAKDGAESAEDGGKKPKGKFQGKRKGAPGKGGGPGGKPGGNHGGRPKSGPQRFSASPARKDKIDPDSPFAALAVLKEKSGKE